MNFFVCDAKQVENAFIVGSAIFKYRFFFFRRAVGCIFGELLNNSPLFPVSTPFLSVHLPELAN